LIELKNPIRSIAFYLRKRVGEFWGLIVSFYFVKSQKGSFLGSQPCVELAAHLYFPVLSPTLKEEVLTSVVDTVCVIACDKN